jgi:stringent starvation protein B
LAAVMLRRYCEWIVSSSIVPCIVSLLELCSHVVEL